MIMQILELFYLFLPRQKGSIKMKTYLISIGLLLLLANTSFAGTGYVSDILVVTVRTEPGNSAEILTTVRTGEALEILEDQKEYLWVRTSEGIEGYVRSQYISSELPKSIQIKQLQEANAELQQKVSQLSSTLGESVKKAAALTTTEQDLAKLKVEYQTLKTAAANVLKITSERDQLLQENSEFAATLQQLKEENNLYLRTGVIKWFLAGAGVLFFGWVLGKASRKKKRNYL